MNAPTFPPSIVEELDELREPIVPMAAVASVGDKVLAVAIEHLARAIEALAASHRPVEIAAPLPAPQPIAQPQVQPIATICPIHRLPWKHVPPGISKKTGLPYEGFDACPTRGCDQRPPK